MKEDLMFEKILKKLTPLAFILLAAACGGEAPADASVEAPQHDTSTQAARPGNVDAENLPMRTCGCTNSDGDQAEASCASSCSDACCEDAYGQDWALMVAITD